ncbi:MAG: tyrosine-type recombinase/integrase [Sporomusaceae bacterium]|nr:tyrosine-type recombinase/integrase [Sporomusaceae bacterium]
MAKKIEKRGENSYRLTVSSGSNGLGQPILHRKTVTAKNQREAEKQYALFIAEIEKGQIASSGKMTLNQYFDYWKEHYASTNLEATTLNTYDHAFKRISAALGQKRLDKIEPIHLNSFFTKLQGTVSHLATKEPIKLSPATIKKHYELLSIMFNRAVKWNLLPFNPVERIEIPKLKHTPKKIYSPEELGYFLLLLETEPLKYKIMILLALTGSLRREEIFGLEWKHIDFAQHTIQIEQAAVYVPKHGIILKNTKTNSSNRLISIPASLTQLLKHHKLEQASAQLELGNKWEKDPCHQFVFTTWNGKAAHPHSINTWLKRFVVEHNLPKISIHAFRHMNATYLITSGVDIRTVAGKLGHSNASTTMDIYSHLVQSAEKETADIMEKFVHDSTEKAKIKQHKSFC